MPRLMGVHASRCFAAFVSSVLSVSVGCQSNSMMTMPWNQASRVPPPSAPTNLPTAPYSSPSNPTSGAIPAGAPAPNSVSSYSSGTLTDAVAAAQNELRLATENARAAIEKSANSVNTTVTQAGARLDRVGSGVVQATGILESSLMDPIPMPSGGPAPVGSQVPGLPMSTGSPSSSSGSISDLPDTDTNAQWRKPTVR